ncbi:MAG: YncE family protein [Gemmatimonadota bacterium]
MSPPQTHSPLRALGLVVAAGAVVAGGACGSLAATGGAAAPGQAAVASPALSASAAATYRVIVGAESADSLHVVRFGAEGAALERTIPVAELYRTTGIGDRLTEGEAPHGLAASPDGAFLYMTTGHGIPDGKLWKIDVGAAASVGDPVDLGRFPASLDVTPDGRFVFVVNFNLHGSMTPSSVSVVYAPDMVEVARTETCTMPHGSRVAPAGTRHYSVCMMDDQLVEIDVRTFRVARRFSVATGAEGEVPDHAAGHDVPGHDTAGHQPTCSPTWAQPSRDGARVYVACNRSDEILEVDVDGWRVSRRFATGRGPYNLETTPDGRLLVVTLKQGHGVEFIDLDAGRTLRRLDSSARVTHGVAVSPDGRFAFVSVEGVGAEPGKVDIYDLASLSRVASVPIGLQASGITFWSMESP